MGSMSLTVFEVHMAPGSTEEELISAEVQKETNAQVMTVAQARKVGFGGLPDLGPNVRLIAVASRDQSFIQKRLEGSNAVAGFRVHHVD